MISRACRRVEHLLLRLRDDRTLGGEVAERGMDGSDDRG